MTKASNLSTLPDRRFAGAARCFRDALRWADRIAGTSLPVYVLGETGTGKEAVARRIHDLSAVRNGPYIAVNCASLSSTLLEAELFGVRKGAYTGAERDRRGLLRQAHGGTLFLDEIGDMPPAMQCRLLRAVQEGRVRPVGGEEEEPVSVRWICASHRRLAERVADGRFRRDLYHRLCTLQVELPPLRERLEDLPLLVAALSSRIRRETGLRVRLRPAGLRWLERHSWPGNVRELHGVLAAAVLRAEGRSLEPHHLVLEPDERAARSIADESQAPLPFDPAGGDDPAARSLPLPNSPAARLELRMIREALTETDGNLTRAATRIGWSRGKLYRRMRALGMKRPLAG